MCMDNAWMQMDACEVAKWMNSGLVVGECMDDE